MPKNLVGIPRIRGGDKIERRIRNCYEPFDSLFGVCGAHDYDVYVL